jgi:hypothetical protein
MSAFMKSLDKRLLGQLSSELSSLVSNMLDLEAGLLKQDTLTRTALAL